MPAQRPSAVKNWCFTWNNPTDDEYFDLGQRLGAHCTAYVFQLEKGASGTPHIQGYACFNDRKRLAGAKAIISERAHLEPARGDGKSNYDYCTKPEGRIKGPVACGWTDGGVPLHGGQGRRLDLSGPVACLKSGGGLGDVIENFPDEFIRYHRGLAAVAQHYAPGRREPEAPQVIWIYGPPGVGKSTYASELWTGGYHKNNSKWWCGYAAHGVVVWDEFSPGGYTFRDLLRALDKFECRVETKGGTTQLMANRFVFTSNQPPWTMYQGQENTIDALLRRITVFVHMTDFEEGHMYFDSVRAQASYY